MATVNDPIIQDFMVNGTLSKLWDVQSYRSCDAEGQGIICRVQDAASTCVLCPCIGTGVVLEFQRSGVLEVQNENKGWLELT